MLERIKKYMNVHELLRLFRFGATGVLNTAVDYGTFFVLAQLCGVNIYLSQFLSYSIATLNSYFVNKKWTFQREGMFATREFVKFLAVNLVSLGASLLLMYLLHDLLGIHKMLAKVLTAFVTIPINFLGNRFWVFDKAEKSSAE